MTRHERHLVRPRHSGPRPAPDRRVRRLRQGGACARRRRGAQLRPAARLPAAARVDRRAPRRRRRARDDHERLAPGLHLHRPPPRRRPARSVFVEAPCYDRSLQILRRLGAEVESIPLAEDGLDLDALEPRSRRRTGRASSTRSRPSRTRAAARSPSRTATACRARPRARRDHPRGRPLRAAPLRRRGPAAPVRAGRAATGVMFMSSFSKTVAPGIRVGYAILPEELMGAMQTLVFENYVSPVMFVEATLHEFVSRGRFDPNVEAIQEALHVRRDAMISALARELPEGTTLERAGRRLLPLGRAARRAERREPPRPGRRGRRRLHQGPRLLLPRRRRVGPAARVLLRAARGDRGGHRPARPARARRARRPCVSRPPFETARLDELARFEGEFDTIPIRIPLGIAAFGVNAYGSREAGGHVIEEHDELGAGAGRHEELYVVLTGRAGFTVAGEEIDAPAGTLVFVRDPAARRAATALEPDTTVLVVGGTVGQAFEPSPWESWLEALPFYDGEGLRRGRRRPGAGPRGAPRQPERPLQPRLLRGARGPARGRDRPPGPRRGARPARREWADDRPRSRLDQRRALGGGVRAGLRAGDEPRLRRRLEPGRLRRPEGRAGAVRQGAQCLLAEIAVFAGNLSPLCHDARGRPSYGCASPG